MIFKINKINKKIIALLLACLFFLPTLGLAGLKLEQRYPDIPGFSQSINKTVEATAQKAPGVSISALIKYLTGLVFVLSIGAATISLIVAGIQYLTNRGNKGVLKTARTRIYKSAIGVAILVGSYLILQLISPSFQVPKLEKIYVSSQVVLFTQEGKDALDLVNMINFTKDTIDELVTQGKARYFSSQWADATEYLGDLTTTNGGTSANFGDFPVIGVGLMGNGADNIKVLTFAGKNFLGTESRYTIKGVFDKDEKSLNIDPVKYISFTETLYYFGLKQIPSTVGYFEVNPITGTLELKPEKSIIHPPLSIAVVGIGPGVYLYSENSNSPERRIWGENRQLPPSTKNGQRYLQSNVSDFADTGFAFDNITASIEIRNNNKAAPIAKENDLMAVLFSDADYKGNSRIFFEKRPVSIPLVYYNDAFKMPLLIKNPINLKTKIKSDGDYYDDSAATDKDPFNAEDGVEIGNIEKQKENDTVGEPIDVGGVDQLGKVEGASSIKIFNLLETANGCEEVRLCNQADLGGYCLSFTASGREVSGLYNSLTLPMPWFAPVSIPEYLITDKDDYLESNVETGERDLSGNDPGVLENGDNKSFAGNIRSIGIDGNCAVALFENAVKNGVLSCIRQIDTNKKDCWDNGGPGEKSQIFSYSDMTTHKGSQISYLNLSDQPIGSCTKREWLIRLKVVPCASAIAVFPVK